MINKLVLTALAVMASIGMASSMPVDSAYAGQANPPGNNGTIKIAEVDVAGEEPSNANDPMIEGCTLSVKFFGYDAGPRTATVTFESQAPTPDTLVSPVGAQPVVFTGGGSGSQLDHTATYTLDFTGEPAAQGYHVKVTVNADGSQGSDKKSKVFWVEGCEGEGGSGGGIPGSAVSLVCPTNTYTLTVANTGTTVVKVTINGVEKEIAIGAPAVTANFKVGDVLTVLVDGQPVTVQGKLLSNYKLPACVGGMGTIKGTGGTVSSGFGAGAATDVTSLPVTSGSSAQLAAVVMMLSSILAAAGVYTLRARDGFSI